MPQPAKILVLSLTRMGDILQCIPFFRRLRLKNPSADIHLLVEQCFADVAGLLPGVDRVHTVRLEDLLPSLARDRDGNLSQATSYYSELVNCLRRECYTEVWNLTHTRPSMVLNYLIAGEQGKGVTLHRDGLQRVNSLWLTYFFATNLARPWCQVNLVDIYANCVDGVDWMAGRSLRLERFGATKANTGAMTRLAIHAGASQKAKQWPVESYRDVAHRLSTHGNVEIVLIGGRNDASIAQAFQGMTGVKNLIGKTTVPELARELTNCHLLLTNDSGPMHVAAAAGTKVIDITVGSALASETAPYGDGHLVVEPDSSCFPCSTETACMNQSCASRIDPQMVSSLAEWALGWRGSLSESEVNGCRVYRTQFSPIDHMLELKRLFSSTPDPRDVTNDIIRPLWLAALSPDAPASTHHRNSIAADLMHTAAKAASTALEAEKAARHLEVVANNNPQAIQTIKSLARRLQASESTLHDDLDCKGPLSSFLRFSDIVRGSISDSTLSEQAGETAANYRTLYRLLQPLSGTKPFQKSNDTNIHLSTEDVYENHTQRC